jgi:hypothetical protein
MSYDVIVSQQSVATINLGTIKLMRSEVIVVQRVPTTTSVNTASNNGTFGHFVAESATDRRAHARA